jgi:two-component system, NarL family, sensor histidine kinase LiaS
LNARGTNQIARQIHDGIAQDLVALGYSIDQSLGAPELPATTRAELRTLRFAVTDLIEKVRREILNLRNNDPDLNEQAIAICGDRLGVFELVIPLDKALNPIAIELLRNAAEHSGANVINLRTSQDQTFTVIEVSDDGTGGVLMKTDRFGLVGITEAVAELSGLIDFIDLAPGLLIRVSIPI